ncbi:MAG TPA: hypothetical protein VK254_03235 [Candidatus Bathyarchaeia archaeon]|nr:hypothetical protein [Candidatus Bathyarchaeia archaeon]
MDEIVAEFKEGLSLMPEEAMEKLAILSLAVAMMLQEVSAELKDKIYQQLGPEGRKLIFED